MKAIQGTAVIFFVVVVVVLFLPHYYDTILIYRNLLKYGRKVQRNHEAYTTWAFHAKLLRINLILIQANGKGRVTIIQKKKVSKKKKTKDKADKEKEEEEGVEGKEQVK